MALKPKDIQGITLFFAGFTALFAGAWSIWGERCEIVIAPIAATAVLAFILESRRRIQAELEAVHEDYRQVESLISLVPLIQPRHPLPSFRRWAVSPDLACLLVSIVDQRRPNLVVELGSGVSTLLGAYRLKHWGSGRILSLEHDEEYAAKTRCTVSDHGLSDIAGVVHAPLIPHRIGNQSWLWYDLTFMPDLGPIDVLLIDGPPSALQPLSRYPALPLLFDRLSDDAVILIDDADRDEEMRVVERWRAEYPSLICETIRNEKGAIILRRRPRSI